MEQQLYGSKGEAPGLKGRRDEMILSIHPSRRPSVHPSRHGLLTPTGRRKRWWSDGPIKLAPLKEEKML
jgi:hypothetical protein